MVLSRYCQNIFLKTLVCIGVVRRLIPIPPSAMRVRRQLLQRIFAVMLLVSLHHRTYFSCLRIALLIGEDVVYLHLRCLENSLFPKTIKLLSYGFLHSDDICWYQLVLSMICRISSKEELPNLFILFFNTQHFFDFLSGYIQQIKCNLKI